MQSIARFFESTITKGLGWALIHFLWQGTVVAVLTASLLFVLRKASSHIRYLVQCATLVVMTICPLATWMLECSDVSDGATLGQIRLEVSHEQKVIDYSYQMTEGNEPFGNLPEQITAGFADATPQLPTTFKPVDWEIPVETARIRVEPNANPRAPVVWHSQIRNRLNPLLPWFVGIWLAGVFVLSCRLLAGWGIVQNLKLRAIGPLSDHWQSRLQQIAKRMGVTHAVRLVESAMIEVPTVIGWLRPLILVPTSIVLKLTPEQLEAILAHELAHIRRHDYLVNLMQSVVETLLFYHPAIWWLSKRLRYERELCCDDIALQICSDKLIYVEALATLEELRHGPALAVAASGGGLLERIRRIAIGPTANVSRVSRWPVALLSLACLAAGFGLVSAWSVSANMGQKTSDAVVAKEDRLFPAKLADTLVSELRKLNQPFLNDNFLNEVKLSVEQFLLKTANIDPSPDQQARIVESCTRYITSPDEPASRRFRSYLGFGNGLKDLLWRVSHAAKRKELSEADRQRFERQKDRMREIVTKPTVNNEPSVSIQIGFKGDDSQLLESLFSDPFWLDFQTPFSDAQMAIFEEEVKNCSGSGFRCFANSLERTLWKIAGEDDRMAIPWHDHVISGCGPIGRRFHEFASEQSFLGYGDQLGSIEDDKRPGLVYLDTGKLITWPIETVPDRTTFQKIAIDWQVGDIGYSPSDDRLIAFRNTRLLQLDTSDWYFADQISDESLRQQIRERGTTSISMADYPKHGFRAVAPEPPLIAAEVDNELFVFQIDAADMGMLIAIRSRPTPLRQLDLTKLPPRGLTYWGHPWKDLQTRITLLDEKPTIGQFRVKVEMLNTGTEAREYALSAEAVPYALQVMLADSSILKPLFRPKRNIHERSFKRVIAPGETVSLAENLDLATYYDFEKTEAIVGGTAPQGTLGPGTYSLQFGGQRNQVVLGTEGASYPGSNLNVILADGPAPKGRTFLNRLRRDLSQAKSIHWIGPDFLDEKTIWMYPALHYPGGVTQPHVAIVLTGDKSKPDFEWNAVDESYEYLGETSGEHLHLFVSMDIRFANREPSEPILKWMDGFAWPNVKELCKAVVQEDEKKVKSLVEEQKEFERQRAVRAQGGDLNQPANPPVNGKVLGKVELPSGYLFRRQVDKDSDLYKTASNGPTPRPIGFEGLSIDPDDDRVVEPLKFEHFYRGTVTLVSLENGGPAYTGKINADGSFEIANEVSPGRYEIRVEVALQLDQTLSADSVVGGNKDLISNRFLADVAENTLFTLSPSFMPRSPTDSLMVKRILQESQGSRELKIALDVAPCSHRLRHDDPKQRLPEIQGIVRDAGEPVANVDVVLREGTPHLSVLGSPDQKVLGKARTDANGRYRIENLPDEWARKQSTCAVIGISHKTLVLNVGSGEQICFFAETRGSIHSMDLDVVRGGSIVGTIELSDGTPLVRSPILLIPLWGNRIPRLLSTDTDGAFQVKVIAPGDYVIQRFDRTKVSDVTVEAGKQSTLACVVASADQPLKVSKVSGTVDLPSGYLFRRQVDKDSDLYKTASKGPNPRPVGFEGLSIDPDDDRVVEPLGWKHTSCNVSIYKYEDSKPMMSVTVENGRFALPEPLPVGRYRAVATGMMKWDDAFAKILPFIEIQGEPRPELISKEISFEVVDNESREVNLRIGMSPFPFNHRLRMGDPEQRPPTLLVKLTQNGKTELTEKVAVVVTKPDPNVIVSINGFAETKSIDDIGVFQFKESLHGRTLFENVLDKVGSETGIDAITRFGIRLYSSTLVFADGNNMQHVSFSAKRGTVRELEIPVTVGGFTVGTIKNHDGTPATNMQFKLQSVPVNPTDKSPIFTFHAHIDELGRLWTDGDKRAVIGPLFPGRYKILKKGLVQQEVGEVIVEAGKQSTFECVLPVPVLGPQVKGSKVSGKAILPPDMLFRVMGANALKSIDPKAIRERAVGEKGLTFDPVDLRKVYPLTWNDFHEGRAKLSSSDGGGRQFIAPLKPDGTFAFKEPILPGIYELAVDVTLTRDRDQDTTKTAFVDRGGDLRGIVKVVTIALDDDANQKEIEVPLQPIPFSDRLRYDNPAKRPPEIKGTVAHEGKPVANAVAALYDESNWQKIAETKTDQLGRYQFENIKANALVHYGAAMFYQLAIRVSHAEFAPSTKRTSIQVGSYEHREPGKEIPIWVHDVDARGIVANVDEIFMGRGGYIEGTIRKPDGAPATNITLRLRSTFGEWVEFVTTDADGKYRVGPLRRSGVGPGDVPVPDLIEWQNVPANGGEIVSYSQIWSRHGYILPRIGEAVVKVGETTIFDGTLPPTAAEVGVKVVGKVEFPKGVLFRRMPRLAVISVKETAIRERKVGELEPTFDPEDMRSIVPLTMAHFHRGTVTVVPMKQGGHNIAAKINDDGTFEFLEPVFPGDYSLNVGVTLQLDYDPTSGTEAFIEQNSDLISEAIRLTILPSDDRGPREFTIPVEPVPFSNRLRYDDPEKRPPELRGVVTQEGLPVANIEVELRDGSATRTVQAGAITNMNGRFRFENLPNEGFYTGNRRKWVPNISVMGVNHKSLVLDEWSGEQVIEIPKKAGEVGTMNLKVVPGGSITGTITTFDGMPAATKAIRLLGGEKEIAYSIPGGITTDDAGTFRAGPLKPGKYAIQLNIPGMPTINRVNVESGKSVSFLSQLPEE